MKEKNEKIVIGFFTCGFHITQIMSYGHSYAAADMLLCLIAAAVSYRIKEF